MADASPSTSSTTSPSSSPSSAPAPEERLFTDPEWLSAHVGFPVESASLESMAGTGGLSGCMRRLTVTKKASEAAVDGAAEETLVFVLKTVEPATLARSKQLGGAREGLFFAEFLPRCVTTDFPAVYFAHGDMSTGEKTILMEDLRQRKGTQSGLYFGPGSPHNWGKTLPVASELEPSAEEVAAAAFGVEARMHAAFWGKPEIRSIGWLRGSDWIRGEGEASWRASQMFAQGAWEKGKAKLAASGEVRWPAGLVEALDASFARIDWARAVEEMQARSATLVHGDCHPANMMWVPGASASGASSAAFSALAASAETKGHVLLLDFEAVGVGSGPQDIAQYLISHMSPATRRACEGALVDGYYAELIARGVDPATFSKDQCWAEYKSGGAERWVWMLGLLADLCPASWVQYFADQTHAFFVDHGITAENIGMPRA